ncbi:MAG: hypothetical protein Q8P36_02135 [bacterium]|nr:hypothetical protein [bacterium]
MGKFDEASDAYESVVRNMSPDDRGRVEAGDVSANECVHNHKLSAAVDAWRTLVRARGGDPGLMHHQV